MKLTANEIRAAVFLARRYRQAGHTVPPSVRALAERLETAVRQGEASPWRQSPPPEVPESKRVDYIGTKLAAATLGWSVRRVQRRFRDLDGRRFGDRLVFPRAAVEAFKAEQDRE